MTKEYLESKGWKLVKVVRNNYGDFQCWQHPDHQSPDRGFFTKTEARLHQRAMDSGENCDCLHHSGGELRSKSLL